MLTVFRNIGVQNTSRRLFSSTATRRADVAKLILIGRVGQSPETRYTASNKEYMTYTIATTNYPPPPANPDGSRPASKTSWHHIFCFNPSAFEFLRRLEKGSQVYAEAAYELREPDAAADPSSPQAQRQIFLRHETMRVLKASNKEPKEEE